VACARKAPSALEDGRQGVGLTRPPVYLRSDNGGEFAATAVRRWLGRVGVSTLYIEPGSPWENGYLESLNGKLRDELLSMELLDTVLEKKVLAGRCRRRYDTARPQGALGYRPPAPEACQYGTPICEAGLRPVLGTCGSAPRRAASGRASSADAPDSAWTLWDTEPILNADREGR
jgi:hypothetical protein